MQSMIGDMPGFTASRQLWEASSSNEFYRLWREKQRFHIRGFAFADFWQYARPEDMDDFTKLLLVGYDIPPPLVQAVFAKCLVANVMCVNSQVGPDIIDQFFSDEYCAGI
jgi:hypothetical protein